MGAQGVSGRLRRGRGGRSERCGRSFSSSCLPALGAGFGYPWDVTNFSGREIGTWRVYERGGSFQPVTAQLAAADAPVRVLVDMTAVAPPEFAPAAPC